MKSKNYILQLKAYSAFEYWAVSCLLLIFACSAPLSNAQISQELDPINLLLSGLNKNVQKVSKTTVPMQPTTMQSTIEQPVLSEQSRTIDTIPLNFVSQVGQQFQLTLLNVPNTSHNIKQKLLKTDMVAFKAGDNKQKIELQKIIEQINSIELKPTEKKPQSNIVIDPKEITTPDEISVDIKEEEHTKPQLIQKTKTDEISQKLRMFSKNSEKPENPLNLAEILFLGGYMKEAAVFYQQALEQIKANDPKSSRDRVWILLQIGNCLKTEDAKTATKMYRQLITEYPDSTWTNLAKAQSKLIGWYQTNKPLQIKMTN